MNNEDKIELLFDYILSIRNGDGSYELFKSHETEIHQLEAIDLFILFERLLKTDQPKDILPYLDKLIHVFSQGLTEKKRIYPEGILSFLHRENEAMILKLNHIQSLLHVGLKDIDPSILLPLFIELQIFNTHYQKLQNVMFPHLEKADERLKGLKIMWTLQDQTKTDLKTIISRLPLVKQLDTELIIKFGDYFFAAFGLIQKEELILFQVALDLLSTDELNIIEQQMSDFEPCFIAALPKTNAVFNFNTDFLYRSETGHLNYEQLTLVLNALPLDITLIDQDDKVIYFNTAVERLFPRSSAVIGRDVRNCHPAESVYVVEEILSAFKNKSRQEATFYIHMKEKYILIRYIALWNHNNDYRGCLEITQEISKIQALKGDRRLLDWN